MWGKKSSRKGGRDLHQSQFGIINLPLPHQVTDCCHPPRLDNFPIIIIMQCRVLYIKYSTTYVCIIYSTTNRIIIIIIIIIVIIIHHHTYIPYENQGGRDSLGTYLPTTYLTKQTTYRDAPTHVRRHACTRVM